MKFLCESLADLNEQFKRNGGPGLFIFRGKPATIFKRLHEELGINKLCYEQDCEPIWRKRDDEVMRMCRQLGIQTAEKVSHTLWDPMDIINVNGGYAPLTYQMMLHAINVLGLPPRPVNDDVDFSCVDFGEISEKLGNELGLFREVKITAILTATHQLYCCRFQVPKISQFFPTTPNGKVFSNGKAEKEKLSNS